MMSLVAYDHSDDSEEEHVILPQSKTTLSTHVSDSAPKKQRESVKITIPSLKEFEDEECPVVPKKPKIQSGSGLFSLLPPPKNTSTLSKPGFVPYVLSSKKTPSAPPKKCEAKVVKNEASRIVTPAVLEDRDYDEEVSYSSNNSSDNSHTTLSKDYFSLDEVGSEKKLDSKEFLLHDLKTDSPLSSVQKNNLIQKASSSVELSSVSDSDVQQTFVSDSVGSSYVQQSHLPTADASNYSQEHSIDSTTESFMNYSTEPVDESLKESLLKDKEFIKLQGHRRKFEAVDIIDVKADDQLIDRNELLTKSLTEESTHRPSRKKCNMPTQQQKRKHQITYLAFQAKEREMDLKNQWAMNSRTRRETQAKYGF